MTVGAHVFALLVILPALMFIVYLLRHGHLRTKYVLLWIPVGMLLVVLSVAPRLLDYVATEIGISYPPTLIMLGAIALLLFVCVHFSWELSRLEERVRLLAERSAIDSVIRPDASEYVARTPSLTNVRGSAHAPNAVASRNPARALR